MDGTSIDLVFDEELDFYGSAGFDSSVYSVTADGSAVTFGGSDTVADEGITPFVYRTLRLNFLSPAITYGQTVIVSYTDPPDDDNVFQDEAGNDVASFTTGSGGVPAVVNNVPADTTPPSAIDIDAKDSVEVIEGRQAGLEVRLRSAPSTDVTVTVMSNDAGKVTVMPASLALHDHELGRLPGARYHLGRGLRLVRRNRDADAERRRVDDQDGHRGRGGRRHEPDDASAFGVAQRGRDSDHRRRVGVGAVGTVSTHGEREQWERSGGDGRPPVPDLHEHGLEPGADGDRHRRAGR